jgi:hypothetical protein
MEVRVMADSDWGGVEDAIDTARHVFLGLPRLAALPSHVIAQRLPRVQEVLLAAMRAQPGRIFDTVWGEPCKKLVPVRWYKGRVEYFLPSIERLFEDRLRSEIAKEEITKQQLLELTKKLAPADPVLRMIAGPMEDAPEASKSGRPKKLGEVRQAARALRRLRGVNEPWKDYISELRDVADLECGDHTIKRALKGWDLDKPDDWEPEGLMGQK